MGEKGSLSTIRSGGLPSIINSNSQIYARAPRIVFSQSRKELSQKIDQSDSREFLPSHNFQRIYTKHNAHDFAKSTGRYPIYIYILII